MHWKNYLYQGYSLIKKIMERIKLKNNIKKPEIEYINKSLLKQRGWTESMIKKFLRDTDAEKDNPMYRSGPPMKLYAMSRVLAAESEDSFVARKAKAESRSNKMKNVADMKKQELMEQIDNMEFKIKAISEENLIKKAIKNYNDFHETMGMERNNFSFDYATPKSDKIFLERIEVNYVRHNLTKYDTALETMAGKIGVHEAVLKIKFMILDAISEKYPYLSRACKLQKNRING